MEETNKYIEGSLWRKWDLHIHSKYSLEDTAKLEIKEIFEKAIDKGIAVISITDHANVDGLDEIWNFWEKEQYNGKSVKDQIEFFPGVELRTERGKHSVHTLVILPKYIKQKRVDKKYVEDNLLHLLGLTVNKIEEAGGGSYNKGLFKKCVNFCDLSGHVKDLGGLTLIHAGSRSNGIEKEMAHSKGDALAHELLNSLGGEKEKIMKEWVDICELPNAEEKSLKDRDFYFSEFGKPCVIFSDTHDSYEGEKFTWIKADPTFEGLRQITFEPIDRIFLGDEPSVSKRVKLHPTKFIQKVNINQTETYDGKRGVWFKNIAISLNPEMVAIIGNKGSGKSAIADVLGLLGESENIDSASFLNQNRFRKAGLAKNFESRAEWASGDIDSKNLNEDIDKTSREKVKYLPQKWFETLCNDLDGKQFSKELEKVVYTHLEASETLGYESFDRLIEFKSNSAYEDIKKLKDDLHEINTEFKNILDKLHPDYEKQLKAGLAQKKRELEAHNKAKPVKAEDLDKGKKGGQNTNNVSQIHKLNDRISATELLLKGSILSQATLSKQLEQLKNLKDDIDRIKDSIKTATCQPDLIVLFGKENVGKLIKVEVDQALINKMRVSLEASLKEEQEKCLTEAQIQILSLGDKEKKIAGQKSLKVKLEGYTATKESLKKLLQKPQKEYQKYLEAQGAWQTQRLDIEGAKTEPDRDTISYYLQELKAVVTEYSLRRETLKGLQKEKSIEIYSKKLEIVEIYRSAKRKVDQVIIGNQPQIDDYIINIEAGFTLATDFKKKILEEHINLRSKGSFMGRDAAVKLLNLLLDDKDFNNATDVQKLEDAITKSLEKDNRSDINDVERQRNITDQLTNTVDFYDYLFSLDYLSEKYQLRLDNKNIESLSPGEKGALLLVFYLMLDQEDIPLVIDQPEDNLDNQSVARILVKFIKGAKTRRQIILVTHNPNLAVVADAEQVIYVSLDKTNNKNEFAAATGAIENDYINKKIVDVLEGTMPAFDKRRLRYLKA